jgi:ubiquitin-conjugating enzyme E2 variant
MEAPMTATRSAAPTAPLTQTFSKRKENAVILAQSYTSSKRAGEFVSVGLFLLFLGITVYNLLPHLIWRNLWIIVVACVLAMAMADLFSGLTHWGADTWGGMDTPFVGKTFIRSFREHHLDPFRITVHDVIETNGDNCMLTLPILGVLAFKVDVVADDTASLFKVWFLAFLCIWVSLTNQIHKWAHMLKPPAAVAFFQDLYVILPRKNHQIHHHTPFDRYYCITTGWLNPLLGAIGFWKRMENTITNITGEIPRKDDAYWTVQAGLQQEQQHEQQQEQQQEHDTQKTKDSRHKEPKAA